MGLLFSTLSTTEIITKECNKIFGEVKRIISYYNKWHEINVEPFVINKAKEVESTIEKSENKEESAKYFAILSEIYELDKRKNEIKISNEEKEKIRNLLKEINNSYFYYILNTYFPTILFVVN